MAELAELVTELMAAGHFYKPMTSPHPRENKPLSNFFMPMPSPTLDFANQDRQVAARKADATRRGMPPRAQSLDTVLGNEKMRNHSKGARKPFFRARHRPSVVSFQEFNEHRDLSDNPHMRAKGDPGVYDDRSTLLLHSEPDSPISFHGHDWSNPNAGGSSSSAHSPVGSPVSSPHESSKGTPGSSPKSSPRESPKSSPRILTRIKGHFRRSSRDEIDASPKAMSMPHGSSAAFDPKDNVLQEVRKQICPDRVDWTVSATNGSHIWLDTESSGCYASQDCKKSGPRKRCTACKVVLHQKCIEQLEGVKCRPTFREATPKGGIEALPPHHIVHRRMQEGRCDGCGKMFQSMLSYKSTKDVTAVSCSWCKRACHLKSDCSKEFLKEQHCDLGMHQALVVPPSWIVKLPPRKYSHVGGKRGKPSRRISSKERRAFVIKPFEIDPKAMPLLVFVNPKSGGNQGTRIYEKLLWLLNPRQVFDLSQGGPRFGLDLYRKVPNLRILVCGGDGTVGWILSEIDRMKILPPPPVSVLPLGTGNDLSRFLGWGAGYTDEPLSKILSHLKEGEVQKLDRWDIDVRTSIPSNPDPDQSEEQSVAKLPLSVMNNYFSLGADADVCLEFHESREANPERFNSRLKNILFYGKAGSKTIVQRNYKDLYKCVDKLLCDGIDFTSKIKELKPLCLVFLNISSYSAGTSPWGHPTSEDYLPQSCDDGYLEIIGLTSKSMVATQVGGHGVRIYQCHQAILWTNKNISMQVDGEPCRLKPSQIHIKRRNQAFMVTKKKPHHSLYMETAAQPIPSSPKFLFAKLYYLTFAEYDRLEKYDIEEIKGVVQEVCALEVDPECQLDDMRKRIEKLKISGDICSKLSEEWCFLDATWTARIYRIDEAQESLMYVGDIMEGGIYILDLQKKQELTPTLSSVLSKSQPSSPQMKRPMQRPLSVPPDQLAENFQRALNSIELERSNHSTQAPPSIANVNDSEDSDVSDSDESAPDSSPKEGGLPVAQPLSRVTEDANFVIPEDELLRNKMCLEAARRGALHQLEALHKVGVSLTVCDSYGRTPLHIAAKHGKKEIVKYIVDKVPSDILDLVEAEHSHTALHKAAYHKRRTICRLLVNKGASLTRQDLEGNTARLLALKAGDSDLAKFLENQERLQMIAADDYETAV